jgi:hypothetical protein
VSQASAIQLRAPVRRACEALLEAREEELVDAWYARVTQEEDWNMNWRLCAAPGPSAASSTASVRAGSAGGDGPLAPPYPALTPKPAAVRDSHHVSA